MIVLTRFSRLCFAVLLAATFCISAAHAQKWEKLAPFPEPSEEVYGIASGGKLYVFGGLAPGWTPKGLVYEFDPATGAISNERPFFQGFERGLPDGSTMDAEGYLWNCRFFGGCVVRVAPSGKVDRIIEMPVKNITTCMFGGPDRTTLYVTTAKLESPPGDRLAGGLFAIPTEVAGQPENRFRVFAARS